MHAALINEIRIGLNRATTALTQEDYGQNLSEQFGIPGVNRDSATSGLSSLAIAGLFNLGGSILTPLRLATTTWNLSEKISWVKGRHTLRVGVDYQYEMGSTGYLVFGRGYYTFLNLTTSTAVGTPGGNAFASFLVGAPFQVLRDEFPAGMVGLISSRYGFYAQDDIKLTPRLTVNIGARYDIMPYPREMHDRLSNFDPATRTMLIAGVNTNPHLVNTDFRNLAPRVGLAYALRFVDRDSRRLRDRFCRSAGRSGSAEQQRIQHSLLLPQQHHAVSVYTAHLHAQQPAACPGDSFALGPHRQSALSGPRRTKPVFADLESQRAARLQHLPDGGSGLCRHQRQPAADCFQYQCRAAGRHQSRTRQPFGPALGEIRALSNSAHSTYHGLQSRVEKRFSDGLYFLGSYTWSKSIDNQSNGTDTASASGQYPQDSRNPGADRGLSSFDRTHRFVGSAVWAIPIGRGRTFGSTLPAAANSLVSGWQLSGIFVAQTGSPFSILMSCADVNAQGNNCRPNRLASGELPADGRSIGKWFDTAAFAIPFPQAYGNAGRNILRGPGTNTFDLGLSRSFAWGKIETRRLQIRSEFFNALNHTNFGLPVNSIDSPSFGTIASSARAREIQLGARVEF